jgi:hypothetical protein
MVLQRSIHKSVCRNDLKSRAALFRYASTNKGIDESMGRKRGEFGSVFSQMAVDASGAHRADICGETR